MARLPDPALCAGWLALPGRDVGRPVAELSQRPAVDGSTHGARRQVHRHRHGPAQRRQVGGRRQARPWLAHFRRRSSGADRPSRLREVPRHGRLHRRQLLLRGDRAGARSASPPRCCRTRSACGRTATPGTPWSRATTRPCAPAIPRSRDHRFVRPNMFGADFVFSVTRDFVKACRRRSSCSPAPTSRTRPDQREIAALAPSIEVQKDWRGRTSAGSIQRVREFLTRNTPT